MISYISFISTIRAFADEHLQVQKFGAEFKEQMPNIATTDEAFPFLFIVPVGNSVKEFTKELEVEIYCVDRLQKDRRNTNYIVSDTELILTDLEVWLDDIEGFDLLRTSPITPINNDLLDYCAGNVMRVRVDMEKQTVCEIPFEGNEPPPIPTCDDAAYIVEYVDGTPIESGTIPSGGSKLITVPNCADATAVLKNTLDETLSTTNIESGASQDIEAPDSTYDVQYENGTPIESGVIPSGNNKVIEVPNPVVCDDTNLQVNTVGVGAFPSGSTIDLQLTDGTNPVNPVSVGVVGDVVTVTLEENVPCVLRSTATLIKTNQALRDTGRDVDFLTLAEVPVHNNGSPTINTTTNRFTDTLGGQSYANTWILDWNTWNGSTLIGYQRTFSPTNIDFDAAIVFCEDIHGGFMARSPNPRELYNIVSMATGILALQYPPFNIFNVNFWSNAENPTASTNAQALITSRHSIERVAKTSLFRAMPVKDFSLSTSNVLS